MRYLTKSRFALALECPTKLEYSDAPAFANADLDNEFLIALAEGGHQVGALAKCLFPDGIEIEAIGHDAQADLTEEMLKQGDITLFEAAIRVGRLFVRTDLLRKSGDVLDLFEVKAKGIDPADPQILGKRGGFLSGMKPYLYDVAFQRYVLKKAYPQATVRSHLVMPNKASLCDEGNLAQRLQVRRDGGRVRIEIDPSLQDGNLARQVLHTLPVDEYLDQLETLPLEMGGWGAGFGEGIEELARRLDTEPYPPRLGSHCKSCQYRATTEALTQGKLDGRGRCISAAYQVEPHQTSMGTVFDLYSSRQTDALLAERKLLLVDIEPENVKFDPKEDEIALSHRQWLQSEEARGALNGPFVRSDPLRAQIEALTYPLHFIDFETSRPALPFHAGRRPYEQLLFQFSHHRLNADGALAHETQHLSESLADLPNFETVRALKTALAGDGGTVLHWWDHERTVLSEVRRQLLASPIEQVADRDELVAFIDDLLGDKGVPGRLFDLGRLVHRTIFFPGTRGSSSLKKVLPALLASSARLQQRYAEPIYGRDDGIRSMNFENHVWVQRNEAGSVIDPYLLLGERCEDPDLVGLERLEDEEQAIADGGAAMVAYGLLQSGLLDEAAVQRLRVQLLRYCELDTLAMVFAWEGLNELIA
ncbi:DUF2779 domain-containing protein [Noviluteimonas gilva]|uniref:DUF2779 domain-containing protein n=1 Tax=Noviluteimonas gilva TaxID=2682097 RepID=A0A7C9LLJ2_9GAMM|nr:DUF2779 domain-containing protein [Lysobacter gilvus]MUV13343.1 DUF2779 domain-containing protein [Lysobacter gilvus]